MGAGLPIITARTAGGAELVSPEAGLVLDDPDDTSALSAALQRFVEETVQSSAMGTASRQVAERHTWGHMADNYLDLFETLLKNKSASQLALAVA